MSDPSPCPICGSIVEVFEMWGGKIHACATCCGPNGMVAVEFDRLDMLLSATLSSTRQTWRLEPDDYTFLADRDPGDEHEAK